MSFYNELFLSQMGSLIINMKLIKQSKAFAIDMDGTFFLGERLLPGALAFLDLLHQQEIPFVFLTNNSSKSPEDYVSKLTRLGLPTEYARVYTSGDGTIAYILTHHPNQRVFLLGTQSLARQFLNAGIWLDETSPEIVVLGFDTGVTYDGLSRLCNWVRAGLPFLATHSDLNCPVEDGLIPDTGSFMALIEASTGREPDAVIGKPNPLIITSLAAQLEVEPWEMTMVGDRLYTDIALGATAGVGTVLVLSGETSMDDMKESPYQPDLICENLAGLVEYLSENEVEE